MLGFVLFSCFLLTTLTGCNNQQNKDQNQDSQNNQQENNNGENTMFTKMEDSYGGYFGEIAGSAEITKEFIYVVYEGETYSKDYTSEDIEEKDGIASIKITDSATLELSNPNEVKIIIDGNEVMMDLDKSSFLIKTYDSFSDFIGNYKSDKGSFTITDEYKITKINLNNLSKKNFSSVQFSENDLEVYNGSDYDITLETDKGYTLKVWFYKSRAELTLRVLENNKILYEETFNKLKLVNL